MGIYVWGTGCGASELLESGLEPDRVTAFVDSYPCGDTFLGKPVLLPEQGVQNVDILQFTVVPLQGSLISTVQGFPGTVGPFFLIHTVDSFRLNF